MCWTLALTLVACSREPDPHRRPTDPVVTGESGLGYLRVGGVELDLSDGRRYFAIPETALGRTSKVTALPAADGEVHLRWQTSTGASIDEDAGTSLALAGDQRLVVDVTEEGATESWLVAITPVDLPPVTATGPYHDLFFFISPRDFLEGIHDPTGYGKFLLIVDAAGTPVWWLRTESPPFDFRATEGGWLTVNAILAGQTVVHTNQLDPRDGAVVSEWVPTEIPPGWDTVKVDVHEYVLYADGSALRTLGGNGTEDITAWGGAADGLVWHSAVEEVDPAGNVTFHWETWGQHDLSALPPEVLASEASPGPWRYLHINSAEAHDEGVLISLRSPNQVRMLDRSTGDTLWRVGGDGSDFVFEGDPRGGFYGQHSARMFDPDRLTVFDNGTNFGSPPTGDVRVVEFLLDHAAGTATHQWEYALAGAGASAFEGNVYRLQDGRTVVGWGTIQEQGSERAPSVSLLGQDHLPITDLRLPLHMHTYRAYGFFGDPITGEWSREPEAR